MLKEIFAVLLLICLLAAALINTCYINALTTEILELVDKSEALAGSGDFEGAAREISDAADKWKRSHGYTRVLLCQTEIDSATDALFDLLGDLYDGNSGKAKGNFEKLRANIMSISEMESASLGSIF